MAHSREDVVASVRASFPKESRARALELLDTYGVAAHERERERVQLAILKLSEAWTGAACEPPGMNHVARTLEALRASCPGISPSA